MLVAKARRPRRITNGEICGISWSWPRLARPGKTLKGVPLKPDRLRLPPAGQRNKPNGCRGRRPDSSPFSLSEHITKRAVFTGLESPVTPPSSIPLDARAGVRGHQSLAYSPGEDGGQQDHGAAGGRLTPGDARDA